ncbi:MAG: DNA-binding domain-containing protein [Ahrensia sp.]|nr:DNA-binding domain-containing protein [Ahrensia sp.]
MLSALDKIYHSDAFAAGLLNPAVPTPQFVLGPDGAKADKRYNVYRNNVTVSLINAVVDIFPAVQSIVGEDNFRFLAREYVRAHPPSSPLLFLYGQDFAAFVAQFEPAKEIPYLADIARIERCWLTAYHAADIAPLDIAELSKVDTASIGDLRFAMHPATGIVASNYPVHDLFLMHRGFMEKAPVDMTNAQSIMLTRPQNDTQVVLLDAGQCAFFTAIEAQKSLGEAAGEGIKTDPNFDLNTAIQMLIGTGATSHLVSQ